MRDVALCSVCGAPVPLVGLEGARCLHCGGAPQLHPETLARLDALRRKIAQTERKSQQIDGQLASFGRGVGLFEIGMAAILWGFIGGLLTVGAAGNLADHQSFFEVLVDPPTLGDTAFSDATFWMTFVSVLGFATCCFFAGLARLVARRQVRFVYPAPPAVAGGPPGCRVCGADLPGSSVVHRCRHCNADNLVDGVHFQRVKDDLHARLAAREHAADATLASRQKMVQVLERLVLGPPFALLLLAPLAFFLGQPHPVWWLVPSTTFALAGLLFAAAAALPYPRARGR